MKTFTEFNIIQEDVSLPEVETFCPFIWKIQEGHLYHKKNGSSRKKQKEPSLMPKGCFKPFYLQKRNA
jgi:hypothetical protein